MPAPASLKAADSSASSVADGHSVSTWAWFAVPLTTLATSLLLATEIHRRERQGGDAAALPEGLVLWGGAGLLVGLLVVVIISLRHQVAALKVARRQLSQASAMERDSAQHLRNVIDALTVFVGLITLDGRLSAVNRAALEAAQITEADVLGKPVHETYWLSHDPEVSTLIQERLAVAIRGTTVRFDVKARIAGGKFLLTDMVFSPLLASDGRISGIVACAADVTELKQTQAALEDSQRMFELATAGSSDGLWEINYQTGRPFFSEGFKRIVGREGREMPVGDAFYQELVHPEDHTIMRERVRDHLEGHKLYDNEFRLKTPSGYRWVRTRGMAERDENGTPIRFAGAIVDVHEKHRLEQDLIASVREQERLLRREHTLLRELDHRVRNNLAGLLGLVSLYTRSGRTVLEVGEAIRGKIFALRQVHDLIASRSARALDLQQLFTVLAEAVVPPGRAPRSDALAASGPQIDVPAAQSSAIAMVVQELFTNSAKHGALASASGRIEVTWQHGVQPGALTIIWRELGTTLRPQQHPPHGTGLGLIAGLCRSELGGHAEFEFTPVGLLATINVTLLGPDPLESQTPYDSQRAVSPGARGASPDNQRELALQDAPHV